MVTYLISTGISGTSVSRSGKPRSITSFLMFFVMVQARNQVKFFAAGAGIYAATCGFAP